LQARAEELEAQLAAETAAAAEQAARLQAAAAECQRAAADATARADAAERREAAALAQLAEWQARPAQDDPGHRDRPLELADRAREQIEGAPWLPGAWQQRGGATQIH